LTGSVAGGSLGRGAVEPPTTGIVLSALAEKRLEAQTPEYREDGRLLADAEEVRRGLAVLRRGLIE
jgi:hypothetical protein